MIAIGRIFFHTHIHNLFSLALALLLGAAAFTTLGLALTVFIKSAEGSSAVVNAIYLPVSFISGAFFSPHSFPAALKAIANVLPLVYMIRLVRDIALHNQQIWDRPGDVAVIAAWASPERSLPSAVFAGSRKKVKFRAGGQLWVSMSTEPQLAFYQRLPEPPGLEVRVNFGIFAGRAATAAEIDELAQGLLSKVGEVSIVAENRHGVRRLPGRRCTRCGSRSIPSTSRRTSMRSTCSRDGSSRRPTPGRAGVSPTGTPRSASPNRGRASSGLPRRPRQRAGFRSGLTRVQGRFSFRARKVAVALRSRPAGTWRRPARVTTSRALVPSCCLTPTLALGTVRPVPTVILLRHGKSSWSDPTLADFDRPLAPRGKRASKNRRIHARERIRPALVLCSPSLRTRQTLEAIEPALGKGCPNRIDSELYAASDGTAQQLQALPHPSTR